ncbi:MAG: threonine synthase [Firmicutes bacterium]|nr:threonine synthase [Bacillota bacterium]
MADMFYYSTRSAGPGGGTGVTASEAILRGPAPDGGLYVPEKFPEAGFGWARLADMAYRDTALEILRPYLTDYTDAELEKYVRAAYDAKFDAPEIAPVAERAGVFFLELFHGRTSAFKDMALSLLPYLLKAAAEKQNVRDEIVVLTATSGDTGKAALEGFAGVEGIKVIVFFPCEGVSAVQKRQMITQRGGNVHVVGVRGNFDDTQTGVKKIFADAQSGSGAWARGPRPFFSSANSINFGRLAPQIAYYFHAYGRLVKSGAVSPGEAVNFTVPTGNFGNILAGYYAKRMGLPVHRLVCASNDNKVLYDFFNTGVYDKNREFILTSSPSMDILVSSNLERLLFHVCGGAATKEKMEALNARGVYECRADRAEESGIVGEYGSGAEAEAAIREVYRQGYVMDPHTAVAYAAWKKYSARTGDARKNVIVATASPYKFAEAVCRAIDPALAGADAFGQIRVLERLSGTRAPEAITELESLPVLHGRVCEPGEMAEAVREILDK